MSLKDIERRFIRGWRQSVAEDAAGPARVTLAVSGGGDSCALLALTCETGVTAREQVTVAYFDHRLRGDAAARAERDVVAALCDRYGARLEAGAWDAPVATEAAARTARYRFLAGVARASGAGTVATGHTSDDQVETVLMHALRGAGLHGLGGMRPASAWPGGGEPELGVARPMLSISRAETRAYCAAQGIAYVDDASNEDARFLRNRVRAQLLPAIDAVTPDGRAAIARMAEEARGWVDAMQPVLRALVMGEEGGGVRLSRQALRALPEGLAPYAYRAALVALLGDAREFERRHYAMMARAHGGATGSTLMLPRGVVLTVDPEVVLLTVGAPAVVRVGAEACHDVPYAGVMGAWRIEVTPAGGGAGVVRLPAVAKVRGWRPGDRIAPRGMRGRSKKLQDYYVDRKVPRRERGAAPVIAAGGDVLWTPFGVAEDGRVGSLYVVRGRALGRGVSLTREGDVDRIRIDERVTG